jgi:hypothetical protein
LGTGKLPGAIVAASYRKEPVGSSEEETMDDLSYGARRVLPLDDFPEHPLPETLADAERLVASIERAVWRETGGGVRDLRVEVNRSGVVLSGRCETYYTKQRAQHAAMTVPGGGPLTNGIEVV